MKRRLSLLLALVLVLGLCTVPASASAFSDVADTAWFAPAVEFVRSRGIMNGTSHTTFDPNGLMSRGMLAAVLHRAAGSPHSTAPLYFQDIEAGTWYIDSVIWCAEKGIVTGVNATTFSPADPVTREQVALMLWRFAGWPKEGKTQPFADEASIHYWSRGGVHWAQSVGILSGKPGNRFDPQGTATRAEVAQMLRNYFKWLEK